MRWRFRSRLKSSLYQAATRVWPRVAAFWHLFVGVLPATTSRSGFLGLRQQQTFFGRSGFRGQWKQLATCSFGDRI